MTPSALLELVKTQFQVLYLDSTKLTNLLRQAIGTYQDKVGAIIKIRLGADEITVDTPDDLLEVVNVADAEGRWHEYIEGAESIAVVEQTGKSVKPYVISYFANLRGMDIDKDELPAISIGILMDYLKALIEIPNTQRARQIANATGLQVEYPSDEELRARKENIEFAMEDSQAMIPMATVY